MTGRLLSSRGLPASFYSLSVSWGSMPQSIFRMVSSGSPVRNDIAFRFEVMLFIDIHFDLRSSVKESRLNTAHIVETMDLTIGSVGFPRMGCVENDARVKKLTK